MRFPEKSFGKGVPADRPKEVPNLDKTLKLSVPNVGLKEMCDHKNQKFLQWLNLPFVGVTPTFKCDDCKTVIIMASYDEARGWLHKFPVPKKYGYKVEWSFP